MLCLIAGKAECDYQHLLDQINQCTRLNEIRAKAFSITNLKDYIEAIGIKHGNIVLRQAICESNWGKSYLARYNHNLFGMMYAPGRHTVAIGSRGNYAVYNSWTDSVDDYLLWQQHKYKGGDYYTFLNTCGYCENPEYVKILQSIKV